MLFCGKKLSVKIKMGDGEDVQFKGHGFGQPAVKIDNSSRYLLWKMKFR